MKLKELFSNKEQNPYMLCSRASCENNVHQTFYNYVQFVEPSI